jgi:hypothetical protein
MGTSTDGCHAREACPAKAGGGHPVIAESAGPHDRSLETLLSRAMTMKIAPAGTERAMLKFAPIHAFMPRKT